MKKVFIFVFLLVPLSVWGQNVVFNPGFDMTPWDTGWTIEIDTFHTNPSNGYGVAIAEARRDTGNSPSNCCYLKTYVALAAPGWYAGEARAEAIVSQTFNEITNCTLKAQIKYYWNLNHFWELKIAIEVRTHTLWHPVWDTVPTTFQGGDTVWSEVSIGIDTPVTGIRFRSFSWLWETSTTGPVYAEFHFWVDDICVSEIGVEENAKLKVKSEKLKISPNPFVSSAIVRLEDYEIEDYEICIYDMVGRLVKSEK